MRGGVVTLVAVLAWQERCNSGRSICGLLFGSVDALFQPAYQRGHSRHRSPADLPSNSLSSFSVQAGRVIRPALGAGLMALGGVGPTFLFNGFTTSSLPLFCCRSYLSRQRPQQSTDTGRATTMLADAGRE
ncbi:MAG: hypothetical protein R2867_27355 [Caldilineaceae bacterium]